MHTSRREPDGILIATATVETPVYAITTPLLEAITAQLAKKGVARVARSSLTYENQRLYIQRKSGTISKISGTQGLEVLSLFKSSAARFAAASPLSLKLFRAAAFAWAAASSFQRICVISRSAPPPAPAAQLLIAPGPRIDGLPGSFGHIAGLFALLGQLLGALCGLRSFRRIFSDLASASSTSSVVLMSALAAASAFDSASGI